MDSVGINLAVCMGQIGFRIIIGRRAAILGKAHTGVPGQIEFVIQNGPFPAHKQQRLVIGKQAHFVGGHQVAAYLLVVDAVAAVAAFGLAVGIRVQRFLAQPTFVAEKFTGLPGVYVPLEETLRGFEAILSGEMDGYPEMAFYNVGTLDDALAKAKKMESGEV